MENYYAMKALFASEDLVKVTAELTKAVRQKKECGPLMLEYDRLSQEAREFDRIARSRVNQ